MCMAGKKFEMISRVVCHFRYTECVCVCQSRVASQSASIFGSSSVPSPKWLPQNKTEQNKMQTEQSCHGNGSGIPLDRQVCECYLILKDFHTTSKFPPDAQKRISPPPSRPLCLSACLLCRTKFLRCEYNWGGCHWL